MSNSESLLPGATPSTRGIDKGCVVIRREAASGLVLVNSVGEVAGSV